MKVNPRFCGLLIRGRRHLQHYKDTHTETGLPDAYRPALPFSQNAPMPSSLLHVFQNIYTFPSTFSSPYHDPSHTYNPLQSSNTQSIPHHP